MSDLPTSPHDASPPVSAAASATGEWAQVESSTATPRAATTATTAASASRQRPLRLRRSRSQVLSSLDAGGSMLQQRGRDLLIGSGLLLLPVVALNLWATTEAFDRTGATTLTAFGGDDVGTGIEDVAAMLTVVCASLAAAVVGCFAVTISLAERFGRPVGMWQALRSTVRRLPVISLAWAVGHVWVPFAATWALASRSAEIGGRLVLVMPLAALLSAATLFVVPVVVAEQAGPVRALRRGWRLAKSRFGVAFGFVLASSLLGSLLLAGIAFLPSLAESGGFITFGSYTWLAQGITGQLAVIIVVPLVACATAEMYLAVRLDAEGLDIALDADAAFGSQGMR